ncbi:hypothetical protein N7457_007264 [Penicillium paradoxum]|uniref:uncharacterized protein n=1 Tax=Penicillium paradoxum TaxID=176176 RepID=UPI0025474449|nr:uncharacterized protein N7457_007264 [Penicillium paradoxum]KAJ5779544.1 hypothetical protein N7457_007264 [Penicillium paradoxum]
MAIGSCFCGAIQVEYKGELLVSGLCHCLDCRKLTGSPYSYNFVVKTAGLNISGNPKEVAKTSDSGNDVKNYFCPDCGTPLFGRKIKSDGAPDEITVVRAGIFDDQILNERKPQAELYTDRRLKWIDPIEEAGQYSGMLSLN